MGYVEILAVVIFALISAYIIGFMAGSPLNAPQKTITQGIDVSYSRIFSNLAGAQNSLIQRSVGNFLLSLWLIVPALTLSAGVSLIFTRIFQLSFLWAVALFLIIFIGGALIMSGFNVITNNYLSALPKITPVEPISNVSNVSNITNVTNQTGGYVLQ